MGNIIASKCRICDFENTFKYGGNRFDYQTNCPVPAINIETREFENVNYKIEMNNPKYKFYSDKELKGDNEKNNTFGNFNLELNSTNNYCPKCKNFSFDFRIEFFTD
ncbi:hypothetical protein VT569_05215 [Flavobacterium psychrophilum]|jgi:hypothetical protein|uniref:hypothetical protein n=1 Tax=Flavobacterium psychrophilum TaxID=96345 RepID=UPI003B431B1E